MNITHYELKVSDAETNREIRLSYSGNENIVIYSNGTYALGEGDRVTTLPRSILENFVRLINE